MPSSVAVLETLRSELRFLENRGYGLSARSPWRANYVFEDSPTCPNFGKAAHPRSCRDCVLIDFVPEQWREHASPCRMIPLNDAGVTLEHLYGCGTPREPQEAVGRWLKAKVKELEARAQQAA